VNLAAIPAFAGEKTPIAASARRRRVELALASALLATPALAQVTHIHLEASTDLGATWSSAVAAEPGREVSVRIRVRLDSAGTTMTSVGLAGLIYQPVVQGWSENDRSLPFDHAPPANGMGYGRVYPYTSVAQGPGSSSGELTTFHNGTTLRIAGANSVTPTTDLRWGLTSTQSPQSLNPTGFSTSLDVVVFRFGVIAGAGGARALRADVPLAWINNVRATWFTSLIHPMEAAVTPDSVHPAEIWIVPSPCVWSCAVVMLAGSRRRGRVSR
jgi:hypothetical protein